MELEAESPSGRRWPGAILAVLILVAGLASGVWLLTSGPSGGAPTNGAGPALTPRVAARISVGAFPNSVAQAAGAVWVAVMTVHPRHQGEVVRVDPKTNRVVARIEMPSFPESLVGAEGSVWA